MTQEVLQIHSYAYCQETKKYNCQIFSNLQLISECQIEESFQLFRYYYYARAKFVVESSRP